MRSILRISDGNRAYPYLLEQTDKELVLYFPDWRPERYNKSIDYQLNIYRWVPQGPVKIFSHEFGDKDVLACEGFRYEENTYNQCIKFPSLSTKGNYYVNLVPIKNGLPSINYSSAQGAFLLNPAELRIDLIGFDNEKHLIGTLTKGFVDLAEQSFSGDNSQYMTLHAEMAIISEEDIYYHTEAVVDNSGIIKFDISDIPYKSNMDYMEGLHAVSIIHVLFNGEHGEELNLDIKSVPFPLTPDNFAQMISASQDKHQIDIPEDMVINNTRIVSKTEQKIVNMTAETDSKANIIQPVFFRVRELAQITVHPAVTENICINLDAYKSQCERFYIKIEGTSFPEIGRVESGIIFKIQGNLLPGAIQMGTYYILNEKGELVTTGKYMYES